MSKNDELLSACFRGAVHDVRRLIASGANVEYADESGWRPLHNAAQNGHLAVVQLLLHHGAMIDSRGSEQLTPLHTAVAAGHVEVAQALLRRGADLGARSDCNSTPLHNAVCCVQPAATRLLLEHGANVEAEGANGMRPLHVAAQFGDCKSAVLLIDHKAQIEARDSKGCTPLARAAFCGTIDVLELLIRRGADLKAETKTSMPWQPMHCACQEGKNAAIRVLVDAGADIEAEGQLASETPLLVAAANGRARTVRFLIEELGANVAARTSDGRTALFIAARNGDTAVVETLLRCEHPALIADIDRSLVVACKWEKSAVNYEPVAEALLLNEAKPAGEALCAAAWAGKVGLVRLLLKYGGASAVDERGEHDMTPLYHAAAGADLETVTTLLRCGARVDSRSSGGWTALASAATASVRVEGCVDALLQFGASVFATVGTTDGASLLRLAADDSAFDVCETVLQESAHLARSAVIV